MGGSEKTKASIKLDTSELDRQLSGVRELLNFPASSFERIPEGIIQGILRNLASLSNDIIISQRSITPTANNTGITILLNIKIGRQFEVLTAALRAMQNEFLLHEAIPKLSVE